MNANEFLLEIINNNNGNNYCRHYYNSSILLYIILSIFRSLLHVRYIFSSQSFCFAITVVNYYYSFILLRCGTRAGGLSRLFDDNTTHRACGMSFLQRNIVHTRHATYSHLLAHHTYTIRYYNRNTQ